MLLDLDTIASTYPMITIRAHPRLPTPARFAAFFVKDAPMNRAPKRRHSWHEVNRSMLCRAPDYVGQITYDLNEFHRDYGDPAGQLFTFEVTHSATTYVYANVAGEVCGGRSISASTTSSPLGKPTSEPVLSAQLRLQYSVGGLAPGRLAAGGCFPPPIRNEVGYSAATRIKGVETDARRRRHAEAQR